MIPVNNIFFNSKRVVKTKAFDSYSQDTDDIYNFYLIKKEEVTAPYKSAADLQTDVRECCSSVNGDGVDHFIQGLAIDESAFELFIVGFIFFMVDRLEAAKRCFEKTLSLLSNDVSVEALTNRAFITMQISQIYDQLNNKQKALASLLKIHQLYKDYPLLFESADSLLASVFFRMSIYSIRVYKTYNLSHATTFLSITYREKFREKYEKYVLEQYLATAYRNYAPTFQDRTSKYIFYKEALKNRRFVADNNNDEFNKVELFYLLSDINRFLIMEGYKLGLIKKHSRIMYKTIALMNYKTKQAHIDPVIRYSMMMSKFFFLKQSPDFYPWLAIASHFSPLCKTVSLKQDIEQFKFKIDAI
jgi:tetratricopeptide (TPR) repeat protein